MTERTRTLAFLYWLLPTQAFAHGEDILETALLQVASLFLFFGAVLLVRLPYAKKALLVTVYLLTTVVLWWCLADWPYQANRRLINLLTGGVPFGSVLAAYGLSTWHARLKTRNRSPSNDPHMNSIDKG